MHRYSHPDGSPRAVADVPMADSVARWLVSGRRLLAAIGTIVTLAGGFGAALVWLGGSFLGPGAKIEQVNTLRAADHDSIIANKRHIEQVQLQVGAVGSVVASMATKTCLDAESAGRSERIKLAQARVPCDSLYRQQGIRP